MNQIYFFKVTRKMMDYATIAVIYLILTSAKYVRCRTTKTSSSTWKQTTISTAAAGGSNVSPAGDPCLSYPCQHGATCKSKKVKKSHSANYYKCVCTVGFSGAHCEIGPSGSCPDSCADGVCRDTNSDKVSTMIKEETDKKRYTSWVDKQAVDGVYVYSDHNVCFCSHLGVYGPYCTLPCPRGHFGILCVGTCPTCKKQDCDKTNGKCAQGCEDGFRGEFCRQETKCVTGTTTCTKGYCRTDPGLSPDQTGRIQEWNRWARNNETLRSQQCVCSDGYKGIFCNKKCPKSNFGFMCHQPTKRSCKRCLSPLRRCDHVTGTCDKCPARLYKPWCKAKKEKKTDAAHQIDTIRDAELVEVGVQVELKSMSIIEVDQLKEVQWFASHEGKKERDTMYKDLMGEVNRASLHLQKSQEKIETLNKKLEAQGVEITELGWKKEDLMKEIEGDTEKERLLREREFMEKNLVEISHELEEARQLQEAELMERTSNWSLEEELEQAQKVLAQMKRLKEVQELEDSNPQVKQVKELLERNRRLKVEVAKFQEELKSHTKGALSRLHMVQKIRAAVARKRLGDSESQQSEPASPDSPKTPTKRRREMDTVSRHQRQATAGVEINLVADLDVTFPPAVLAQPDLSSAVASAMRSSADDFRSDVIPELEMDENSVKVTNVQLPEESSSEASDRMLPTAVLYTAAIILIYVIIFAAVMWVIIRRSRKSSSQRSVQTVGNVVFHPHDQSVPGHNSPPRRQGSPTKQKAPSTDTGRGSPKTGSRGSIAGSTGERRVQSPPQARAATPRHKQGQLLSSASVVLEAKRW